MSCAKTRNISWIFISFLNINLILVARINSVFLLVAVGSLFLVAFIHGCLKFGFVNCVVVRNSISLFPFFICNSNYIAVYSLKKIRPMLYLLLVGFQMVEVKEDLKVLSIKEVVARETAQLLEQQKRLSVRDLASKFEKGLAATEQSR